MNKITKEIKHKDKDNKGNSSDRGVSMLFKELLRDQDNEKDLLFEFY